MTDQVYLPMDCPVCGRSRVEWNGKVLRCEKCTTSSEFDGFTEDRYKASQPLIARVRELEEQAKAGAHWEERAQEHRMRVRELESEVAQLKVDLNEARGAAVDSIFDAYSRKVSP